VRALAVRAAARAEQEIRAYPRLHAGFYAVITRNPALRNLAGKAKTRVRGAASPLARPVFLLEDPEVQDRRRTAVAARLGLRP
jgi:hypothetical protein